MARYAGFSKGNIAMCCCLPRTHPTYLFTSPRRPMSLLDDLLLLR
jgi:hypothetical protein